MKMSFEVADSFQTICNELQRQTNFKESYRQYDFLQLLKGLKGIERYLLARQFCNTAWNIGSLKVLKVLQQLRILTASEFILSFQDADQIQLILNDFYEAEFELLANLFTTAHFDALNQIKLNSILDESLRRLFVDLIGNENLNDLQYLQTIQATLPSVLIPRISQKHINIVLSLHSSNLKQAFANFSKWINEGVDQIKFTKDLYTKLICHTTQDALGYLFKLSTVEYFREWKYYLILLQIIVSKCEPECSAYIRKYLKSRFRQVASMPNKTLLLHLLLTVRAATATTMEVHKNVNAYADWYKQNIGEMKFVLTTDEFQNVLTVLEQCVDYEYELDYIEVHGSISISPPVLCGKLVQTYKSKCKRHLLELRRRYKMESPTPADESIIIEDSD